MSRWLATCLLLAVVGVGVEGRAWFGAVSPIRGWAKYMATKAKVTPQPRSLPYNIFHGSIQLPSKTRVTRCPVNVYFLIDGSDSIPADMYTKELEYIVQEITSLTNDFPLSKVGVIVYSNGVTMEFPLKPRTSADLNALYTEIRSFPQPRLGTHITEALVHARDVLKTYTNEGNVIIALTDGCFNNRKGTTNAALSAVLMDMYIRAVSVYKPNVRLMAATMSSNIRSIDVPNDWKEILACPASVLQDLPASSVCDDFIFVVDGSDSLCNEQQDVVKGYLERTIKRYTSVTNAIGVTVFSENIASQIALTMDKDQLIRQIDALNFPGGGTSTNRGIKVAVNQLLRTNRGNGCTLVLITDGPPLDVTLAVSEAEAARAAGCTVLVVGIGSEVQRSTLVQLAGDNNNIFTANTYIDLYQQDLSTKICGGTNPRCQIPCYHGNIQQTPCKCICNQGYTGVDCNTPTSNGCQKSCVHGVLSSNTYNCRCICNPGYTGPLCDTPVSTCSLTCFHGYLDTSTCRCQCDSDWTGDQCDIKECFNTCYNGGRRKRVNDNCTCVCPVGWIGESCQTRDCSKTPCQNGGRPTQVGTGQCGCSCPVGTTGQFCGTLVPRCTLTCMNGNLDLAACNCNCYNGWTGNRCQNKDCRATPCRNGGSPIVVSTGQCGCSCPVGTTGQFCETLVPRCTLTCVNGNLDLAACNCNCYNGWTGNRCQNKDCSATPCRNGGSPIVVSTGQCGCSCPVGTTGQFCEILVPQCTLTCMNGNLDPASCTCNCDNDWTGTRCDTPICSLTCVNGNLNSASCSCTCYNGWTGNRCQTRVCSLTCLNGNLNSASCTCNCDNGWTGTRCDTPICSLTCVNGNLNSASCSCTCYNGWTGNRCQTPVCSLTCLNGNLNSASCTCNCDNGWTGTRCDTPICSLTCVNGNLNSASCSCTCYNGWTGNRCENCVNNGQCLNGGVVTKISANQCGCNCQPPFTGSRCQNTNCGTCLNGGSMSTSTGVCSCNCINGYSGQQCQLCNKNCNSMRGISAEVNGVCKCVCRTGESLVNNLCQRSGLPCSLNCVNGRPSSNTNNCQCICNPGWGGQLCDQKVCSPADCNYQGTARFDNKINKCVCICNPNYYGDHCENERTTPVPVCPANYCNYHGSVSGTPGNCHCFCNQGYTGSRCDTAPGPSCDSSYCNYHGTATGSGSNCVCTCNQGYTGPRCNTPPGPSCDSSYCNYHGTATGSGSNCVCTCNQGYTGPRCNTPIPRTCAANYCNYHGSAFGSPPNCQCSCTGGYTGSQCQYPPASSCDPSYCNYHGTPTGSPPNCACFCDSGYTGPTCNIPNTNTCTQAYCSNHGNPTLVGNTCMCACDSGYTGRQCQNSGGSSVTECTGADNPCLNGQKAYRDSCTNKCVCRCQNGFAGPRCEIVVEPTVCDNCTFINGVGYVPVKGRCDMYVQCDINSYYVRVCAPGTLWSQARKTCDHPQLTTCAEDACASLSSGAFYVHNRECQKYWVCSAGKTVDEGCCPEGQGFNSQTGTCEVDPNCIMTCNGQDIQCKSNSPFCHLKEDPNDKKAYLEPATINDQAGFVRKECGPRTMFNGLLCVCVHDPDEAVYDCSSPATEPDEELTFNTIQKTASYEGVGLTDSVAGVDDKAGEFQGMGGRVIWWRFANAGFSHNNTVIRMRVQPGQFQPGQEYAIISNGDCDRTASLSISMTTNKIIFTIRSENADVKKTQEINYSVNSNEWIEIELRYTRQSARGYTYVGYVKGNGGRQNTNELVVDGPIGTRTCALQVGHGSDTIQDFVGFVDWVRVWDRCAPAEL